MWQISRPPCKWCEFGQVFNGQLGHLYRLGDWKTAESWPMLIFFGQNQLKFYLNGGHHFGHRVTESQSYRLTDTQGYPVHGLVNFFVPDSINSPTRFAHRGITS